MKKKSIKEIIDKYEVNDSCVVVYDLNKLKENIQSVIYLRKKHNVDFIFPIKTFPNSRIIKLFENFGFCFDIALDSYYDINEKIF